MPKRWLEQSQRALVHSANAMAGAIFHAATATGKFHGVITPTTPGAPLSPQYQYLV